MNKKIYKYKLTGDASTEIVLEMPEHCEFLSAGFQEKDLVAWFLVMDDGKPKVRRKFYVFGTGEEVPMKLMYLGTSQLKLALSYLVLHLFTDHPHGA